MKNFIVASAAALLLGMTAAQADTYVSVLGGPTFAPDLPLTAAMATVLVVIALAGQLLAGRFNKKATSNASR